MVLELLKSVLSALELFADHELSGGVQETTGTYVLRRCRGLSQQQVKSCLKIFLTNNETFCGAHSQFSDDETTNCLQRSRTISMFGDQQLRVNGLFWCTVASNVKYGEVVGTCRWHWGHPRCDSTHHILQSASTLKELQHTDINMTSTCYPSRFTGQLHFYYFFFMTLFSTTTSRAEGAVFFCDNSCLRDPEWWV